MVQAIARKVEERGPEDNFTAVLVRALGTPNANAPVFSDHTRPMEHSSSAAHRAPARSGGSALATLLALLALAMRDGVIVDGHADAIGRMVEVGKALRATHGADVIVMGCAGMARHRRPLEQELGIPVIDPTQAAVAMAIGTIHGFCST